jgi:hypothetical protein
MLCLLYGKILVASRLADHVFVGNLDRDIERKSDPIPGNEGRIVGIFETDPHDLRHGVSFE